MVVLAAPAPAGTERAPTLRVSSTVHGQSVPALARGSWQLDHGRWRLDLRSVATPLGRTTVSGSWTSPVIRVGPHQIFFAWAVETEHQGQSAASNRDTARARVCYLGAGCEKQWWSLGSPSQPQAYTSAPPFVVSSGHGLTFGNGPRPMRVYLQWQYRLTQIGADEQKAALTVAVGRAAAALDREETR